MTYAPNDPDVNQMMAVFDKLSRQADTAKDEMAMAVNSFVGRAQDIIATKIAEEAECWLMLTEEEVAAMRRRLAEVERRHGNLQQQYAQLTRRLLANNYYVIAQHVRRRREAE